MPKSVTLDADLNFDGLKVSIRVVGDDALEAGAELDKLRKAFMSRDAEGEADKTPARDPAKPVRAAEARKDKSLAPQRAKDEALKLLAELFGKPEGVAGVNGIAARFGVKKFAEVPAEKGEELLAAAKDLAASVGV